MEKRTVVGRDERLQKDREREVEVRGREGTFLCELNFKTSYCVSPLKDGEAKEGDKELS